MNPYLKYTGMAFQLVFFILAGYWIGKWVANYFGGNETTGTAIGIIFFLGAGLFKIIRDVLKELN
jgi:hypothetical protein